MLREPAAAPESSGNVRPGFEDGLGRRYRPAARIDSDAPLEILCFRHEITDVPAFEFALRERVARFSDLQHPSFTRIRKVDRLSDEHGTVVLMSDGAAGARLIDILSEVERSGRVLDLNVGAVGGSAAHFGAQRTAPARPRGTWRDRAGAFVRDASRPRLARRIRIGRSARAIEVLAGTVLERASRRAADERRAVSIRRARRSHTGGGRRPVVDHRPAVSRRGISSTTRGPVGTGTGPRRQRLVTRRCRQRCASG